MSVNKKKIRYKKKNWCTKSKSKHVSKILGKSNLTMIFSNSTFAMNNFRKKWI